MPSDLISKEALRARTKAQQMTYGRACAWYRAKFEAIVKVLSLREASDLEETILTQERQHRNGFRGPGHYMPLTVARDYFVVKVLTEAPRPNSPITRLVGVRSDHVQGALLMAGEARGKLLPLLKDCPPMLDVWGYTELIAKAPRLGS